jgi:hypothetical protein
MLGSLRTGSTSPGFKSVIPEGNYLLLLGVLIEFFLLGWSLNRSTMRLQNDPYKNYQVGVL